MRNNSTTTFYNSSNNAEEYSPVHPYAYSSHHYSHYPINTSLVYQIPIQEQSQEFEQQNSPIIEYGVADGGSTNQGEVIKGGKAKAIGYSLKHSRCGYNRTSLKRSSQSTVESELKLNEGNPVVGDSFNLEKCAISSPVICISEFGKIEGKKLNEDQENGKNEVLVQPFPTINTSSSTDHHTSTIISVTSTSTSSSPRKSSDKGVRPRKNSIKKLFRREPVEEVKEEEMDQLEELCFELPKVTLGPRFSIGAVISDVTRAQDNFDKPKEHSMIIQSRPRTPETNSVSIGYLKKDVMDLLESSPETETSKSSLTSKKGLRRILPFLREKKSFSTTVKPIILESRPNTPSVKGSLTNPSRKLQKKRPALPKFSIPEIAVRDREEIRMALAPTDVPPLEYYTLPRSPPPRPSRDLQIPHPTLSHRKSSSLPCFATVDQDFITSSPIHTLTQEDIVSNLPLTRRKKKGIHKIKDIRISDWLNAVEVKEEESDLSSFIDYPSNLEEEEFSPPHSALDPDLPNLLKPFAFGSGSRDVNQSQFLDLPRTPSVARSSANSDLTVTINSEKLLGSPIKMNQVSNNKIESSPLVVSQVTSSRSPNYSSGWIRKRSTSLQNPNPSSSLPLSKSLQQKTSLASSSDERSNFSNSTGPNFHRRIPTLESQTFTETDSSLSDFDDEAEDEDYVLNIDSSNNTTPYNQSNSSKGIERIQPIPLHNFSTLPTFSNTSPTKKVRPTTIFARFPAPPNREASNQDIFNYRDLIENDNRGIETNDVEVEEEEFEKVEKIVRNAQVGVKRMPSLVKTGSLSRNTSLSSSNRELNVRDTSRNIGAATALREMLSRGLAT